jgi:hypothetical protein
MSDDEKIDIRLQCLSIASRCAGEDINHEYVLENAKDFYEWIMGKRAELRVVVDNENEPA